MPGLSPLARGTRFVFGSVAQRPRFIPAGAGNTGSQLDRMALSSVYPRWRGEHVHHRVGYLRGDGLSPLARGTLPVDDHAVPLGRFIPAGAGNTLICDPSGSAVPVYPRWRGEHLLDVDHRTHLGGLSPLARGTLQILFP